MANIVEFLKTIYLGDRGCKAVVIDGWNSEVKIQVTCISRVRSAQWDFYTAEDLVDGFLVFKGVESIVFDPPGFIPNDLINDIRAERLSSESDKFLVILNVNSVDVAGGYSEVEIKIVAGSIEVASCQGVIAIG